MSRAGALEQSLSIRDNWFSDSLATHVSQPPVLKIMIMEREEESSGLGFFHQEDILEGGKTSTV